VVCGNSFLADQFSRWNPTSPSSHGGKHFMVSAAPARRRRPASVLGWTGTSGNFPFLYAIEEHCCGVAALQPGQAAHRRRSSTTIQALPESRVEFQRWTPRTELAAFARMSIGLMPLADNAWCNGKCSYKMLCYMAAGLPVVVTAAGMNREVLAMGEVGLSAACEQEWVDALTALLDDADLRHRMGAAGRAVVEERFSLHGWRNNMRRISVPGRRVAARVPSKSSIPAALV
jgi:hypothetical protein